MEEKTNIKVDQHQLSAEAFSNALEELMETEEAEKE